MSGQCSLCLSCGAPFIPLGEDVVEYDRLGNISVFYFQKMVKKNDLIQKTVKNPSFCAKANASHILHDAHHRHAVEYVIEKRLLEPERADDYFPFMRNPKGKTPVPMLAKWATVPPRRALDFGQLSDLINSLQEDGRQEPDYSSVVSCCQDCNLTMTMKFWFKYHLCAGSDVNPSCLIPDEKIRVWKARLNGRARKLETSRGWTEGVFENRYPLPRYSEKHDVLTAMLAYYVDGLCTPYQTPDLVAKHEHNRLYRHMCWVVLEVTCLLCEYWRGSGDAENYPGRTKKRYRCCKVPLGAAELYFSYFCYRIGGFQHSSLRALDFKAWHQIYMWHASGCEALFPRQAGAAGSRLMADRISPDDMNAGSRELVQTIARNMTSLLQNKIMRLVRFVAGADVPRERLKLKSYFIPRHNLQQLNILMMRGAEPDFDSFAQQVGIDAMMARVIALSRDFDDSIRRQLLAFRAAWRRAEVQNVARAAGKGEGALGAAGALYRLCKLLQPPSLDAWERMTTVDARLALLGPQCSPWAAVLALNQLGAFDAGSPEDQQLLIES